MYQLSRLLLIMAVLAGLYSLAIIVSLGWPGTGFMLALVGFGYRARRRRHIRLTTLGSARFVEETELRRTGMLNVQSGLILGRLPARRRFGFGIGQLFRWRLSAAEACCGFWSRRGSLVRLPQAIHTVIFGPTGGGKGVSFVIPTLKTFEDSCVVVDFKGENAKLTADHRHQLGHKVVLLDPYQIVTQKPATFNPLDFIDKDNPQAIDECNDLAKALVVRTGNEHEPYWLDSAEAYIAAIIAVVVWYGEKDKGTRSLQTVREILSIPAKLEMAIKLMAESDAWGGHLAQMGGQLLHFVDKEKSSVLSSALRHLRFLGTPAIAKNTSASSFDPAELRNDKMTVYLILPPEHMRSQAGLLRMWIGSLLRAVVKGGLQR